MNNDFAGRRKRLAAPELGGLPENIQNYRMIVNTLRSQRDWLAEALRPFALFASRFDAKPINTLADEIYGIHSGFPEIEAYLRLSDCRNARAALAELNKEKGK